MCCNFNGKNFDRIGEQGFPHGKKHELVPVNGQHQLAMNRTKFDGIQGPSCHASARSKFPRRAIGQTIMDG